VHCGFSEQEFLNCGHEKAKYFLRSIEAEQNAEYDFMMSLHGVKPPQRAPVVYDIPDNEDFEMTDDVAKEERGK